MFTAVQLVCMIVIFAVMQLPYVSLSFPAFISALVAVPFILRRWDRLRSWKLDAEEVEALDGHDHVVMDSKDSVSTLVDIALTEISPN